MKKEKKKEKQHICIRCRKKFPESKIKFAPDPFKEEIHNDDTPVWECESCRKESASDI